MFKDIQVGLGGTNESGKITLILALDVLKGNNSGGLLVNDGTEAGLALHDNVGDTHLAAEGGQENDELNGVNIVGDDNERSLLGLDKSNDVVETVLDKEGLLGLL